MKYTDQEGVSVVYEYNGSVDPYLMSAYKLESNSEYYIKNTYDSEMRVVEQEDALGSISKLEYYSDYTHITDNEGNNQKIYFNEMGYTTKVINSGEITEYTYDKYG